MKARSPLVERLFSRNPHPYPSPRERGTGGAHPFSLREKVDAAASAAG